MRCFSDVVQIVLHFMYNTYSYTFLKIKKCILLPSQIIVIQTWICFIIIKESAFQS